MFADNGFVDFLHLLQPELSREDDHIGKLGVEAERFHVGNAELGGNMDFQADLAGIQDAGHVGSDDGVHARFLGEVQHAAGLVQFLTVQGDVQGEIGLESIGAADAHHLRKVLRREIVRGMGPHVQVADSEIDGVRTSLNGGGEAFEAPCRSHDFQFLRPHRTRSTRSSANCLRTV